MKIHFNKHLFIQFISNTISISLYNANILDFKLFGGKLFLGNKSSYI